MQYDSSLDRLDTGQHSVRRMTAAREITVTIQNACKQYDLTARTSPYRIAGQTGHDEKQTGSYPPKGIGDKYGGVPAQYPGGGDILDELGEHDGGEAIPGSARGDLACHEGNNNIKKVTVQIKARARPRHRPPCPGDALHLHKVGQAYGCEYDQRKPLTPVLPQKAAGQQRHEGAGQHRTGECDDIGDGSVSGPIHYSSRAACKRPVAYALSCIGHRSPAECELDAGIGIYAVQTELFQLLPRFRALRRCSPAVKKSDHSSCPDKIPGAGWMNSANASGGLVRHRQGTPSTITWNRRRYPTAT